MSRKNAEVKSLLAASTSNCKLHIMFKNKSPILFVFSMHILAAKTIGYQTLLSTYSGGDTAIWIHGRLNENFYFDLQETFKLQQVNEVNMAQFESFPKRILLLAKLESHQNFIKYQIGLKRQAATRVNKYSVAASIVEMESNNKTFALSRGILGFRMPYLTHIVESESARGRTICLGQGLAKASKWINHPDFECQNPLMDTTIKVSVYGSPPYLNRQELFGVDMDILNILSAKLGFAIRTSLEESYGAVVKAVSLNLASINLMA